MQTKLIKRLVVNTKNLDRFGETRTIKVIGDPGAAFLLTITNAANVDKISTSAIGYNVNTGDIDTIIPESGVYIFNQDFPAVSTSEKYKIKIKKRFDSELASSVRDYIVINQWCPTTLTLTLASAANASSYDSHGSNYGVTNVTISGEYGNQPTGGKLVELDWTIKGASGGDITISRQPKASDFSNNIANDPGLLLNTQVVVKALSNADRGKFSLSDTDADLISSGLVVEKSIRTKSVVEEIVEEAEAAVAEVTPPELAGTTEESTEESTEEREERTEERSESGIDETEELTDTATTVKQVTVSAIDKTNNFVTISTSQSIKYGDIITLNNGGTVVNFSNLKAVQLADSEIRITASIKTQSIGVQNVTSTLALDNFITV